MECNCLLKGALIGFSIAMPVGPIGLLCIRNSLTGGIKSGLATGLGAAIADAIYGALAGFSLVAITSLLLEYTLWLHLIGGLFLCYLGMSMFRPQKNPEQLVGTESKFGQTVSTTFFLTLTNPMTILSYIAMYASLDLAVHTNSLIDASLITLGVFLGSGMWWLILSTITSTLKNKLNATISQWLNKLSGTLILGFGIASLVTA